MTAERIYALLLLLYPARFRRQYGGDMLDAFRDLRDAHRGSRLAFWRLIAADVCRSAVANQIDACRSGPRRFALEWTCTCAAGAIITALLANALTAAFRYLYHPYLEGIAVPAWSYGALLGVGLGAAQSVVLKRRVRPGVRWIAGSALGAAIGLEAAIATARIAGPIGYGMVLGGIVGATEWAVLRAHVQRAGWWALASSVALSAAMFSCAATIHTTFQGLNPISSNPLEMQPHAYDAAVGFLARGLYAPASSADLTLEFAVMLICGLVIAVLTAKPLAVLNGHQDAP